jgi:hypothetical protein
MVSAFLIRIVVVLGYCLSQAIVLALHFESLFVLCHYTAQQAIAVACVLVYPFLSKNDVLNF